MGITERPGQPATVSGRGVAAPAQRDEKSRRLALSPAGRAVTVPLHNRETRPVVGELFRAAGQTRSEKLSDRSRRVVLGHLTSSRLVS
jgi:hypothetical protein